MMKCVCGGFGLESEGVGSKGLRSVRRVWGSSVKRGFKFQDIKKVRLKIFFFFKRKEKKRNAFLDECGRERSEE